MPSRFCALRIAQIAGPNSTGDGLTGLMHRAGRRGCLREVWALCLGLKHEGRQKITVVNTILQLSLPSIILMLLASCQHATNPSSIIDAPVSAILFTVDNRLCVLEADGKTIQVIATGPPMSSLNWEAHFSPDGSKIVYGATVDRLPRQILLYDRLTQATSRITSDSLFHESPMFSPDGKSVIFLTSQGWLNSIFAKKLDSGQLIQLTFGLNCYEPSFSSDGSKIVFWMNNGSDSAGVALMDREGSHIQLLGPGYSPVFFPDGSKILFQHPISAHDQGLHTMNIDGSNRRFLSRIPWQTHPDISPDGNRIVFSNYVVNFEVFLINKDGGDAVNLTRDPSAQYWPQFSKDGRSILFASWDTSGTTHLELMNIDGSNRRQIFRSDGVLHDPSF